MRGFLHDVDNVALAFLVIALIGISFVIGMSNHRFHKYGLKFGWKLDFWVWVFFVVLTLREANRMRYRWRWENILPDDNSLIVFSVLLAIAAGGMVISWIGERSDRKMDKRLGKPKQEAQR